jgi:hypothetical protein
MAKNFFMGFHLFPSPAQPAKTAGAFCCGGK